MPAPLTSGVVGDGALTDESIREKLRWFGVAREAERVTRAAVKAAKFNLDELNDDDGSLRKAWTAAGNANLRAHEVTSRAFSDVCAIADTLAAKGLT